MHLESSQKTATADEKIKNVAIRNYDGTSFNNNKMDTNHLEIVPILTKTHVHILFSESRVTLGPVSRKSRNFSGVFRVA